MFRAFVRCAVMLGVTAFAVPALACFPPPDFKPTNEISIVDLPQQVVGISVVFESEGYALRVAADDLLPELSKSHMSAATPNDLENALRSKMALGADLDTHDLIAALTSDPGATASEAVRSKHSGTVIQANGKLRYAFANLLEQGKAFVTELAVGTPLARLKLDRFTQICHRGRSFTTLEGKQILHMVDSIS